MLISMLISIYLKGKYKDAADNANSTTATTTTTTTHEKVSDKNLYHKLRSDTQKWK